MAFDGLSQGHYDCCHKIKAKGRNKALSKTYASKHLIDTDNSDEADKDGECDSV